MQKSKSAESARSARIAIKQKQKRGHDHCKKKRRKKIETNELVAFLSLSFLRVHSFIDTSLKDGLFHEYKKHGKVTMVKVVGLGTERFAVVCFKKPEDVEKALEVSKVRIAEWEK